MLLAADRPRMSGLEIVTDQSAGGREGEGAEWLDKLNLHSPARSKRA